ncbi:MAG: MarR family transcriptional regulator [Chloroflexi bacterium]|nr:MarR family transcriptional regulator [Chloroflexota bacterium]MCH7952443.1 MarR family transcriptional regulator [Chloroflexota bacterium]MCI0782997.1 MarR family transcriptional regulator [Chloroflexota bacterium]MCI0814958.1 MarR family transcriptional regulator [Chloroflexota bacterium]MCI0817472.1 MarR family transcriptional regulator [Chloroflexota bacterium]
MQITDSEVRTQAYQLLGQLLVRADPARMEQWAGLGLTMTQVRVLYTLQMEDGLAAGELAERLNVRPSTVTRIVDRLVRNKLVARDLDESDRRLVRHRLTTKGADVFRELQSMGRERLTRVFDRLDDRQVERVVEALQDLIEAVEAVASEEQG